MLSILIENKKVRVNNRVQIWHSNYSRKNRVMFFSTCFDVLSNQTLLLNVFGNWMTRYIEKTILVLILYNLTSYVDGRPMKGAILTFFYCYGHWCKMQAISKEMQARNE